MSDTNEISVKAWQWRGMWLARATRQWLSCVAGCRTKMAALHDAVHGVTGASNALDFEGEMVRRSARDAGYERPDTTRRRVARCQCGSAGQPEHECPYAMELGNDDRKCTCCAHCQAECADDI